MASKSLCSSVPQHPQNPLGLNQTSKNDGSEIELLKSRVAELERKFDELSRIVPQVKAELAILQRTRNQSLGNEIQLQVGWSVYRLGLFCIL